MHKKCFRVHVSFFSLFLFLLAVPLTGARAVSLPEIYGAIDSSFSKKSEQNLAGILSENRASQDYPLYENYIMKKIRQLVIAGDFTFAREACLVVIDANMDNSAAIEMYSVIDDGIAKQKAAEEAERRRKEIEAARLALERQQLLSELGGQYQKLNTRSGNGVYVKENSERYSPVAWWAEFGMADIASVSVTGDNYTSTRYGVSTAASLEYNLDTVTVGADADADILMLVLSDSDGTVLSSCRLVPKIAFSGLSSHLFFRTGAAALMTNKSDSENKVIDTFVSPLFGISLSGIRLGDSFFSTYYDYYFGHFAYSDLTSAMEGGAFFNVPIVTLEQVRIGFNIGLKDTVFVRDDGLENRVRGILAIGVGNVTR